MPSQKALNHDLPVADQIQECISSIRKDPADVKYRVALSQLYMATRQWQKASDQLERAAQIAPACLPLAAAYNEAIRCEMLRSRVFTGERSPTIQESAPGWLKMLTSALREQASNNLEQATQMRNQAFDEAAVCRFEVDGQSVAWLADADSQLGPVCELFMDGDYHWIPFSGIAALKLEAPMDLRDLFWMPCSVQLVDGQAFHALMPSRYPDNQAADSDDNALLCRKTEWHEIGHETWIGVGQKTLIADNAEFPILSVRSVVNQDCSN